MATRVSRKASSAPAQRGATRRASAPAQSEAQAGSPAQTTKPSIVAKVAKIGFDNGNERIPIVLMDKKMRGVLGVEPKDLVVVSKGDKSVVAFVHIQFWELVGTGKITLNGNLARAISADMDSEVKITLPSDEQRETFQRAEEERLRHFLSNMFAGMASGLSQPQDGEGE